ncbi:hypothetical protein RUM44_003855 [Polyplax serrata]|uniref:Uncharacterized protein n=1 Tax=Polyplax serrata TaxID=468196 RepID=A0ABR1B175_POLSC
MDECGSSHGFIINMHQDSHPSLEKRLQWYVQRAAELCSQRLWSVAPNVQAMPNHDNNLGCTENARKSICEKSGGHEGGAGHTSSVLGKCRFKKHETTSESEMVNPTGKCKLYFTAKAPELFTEKLFCMPLEQPDNLLRQCEFWRQKTSCHE